MSTLGWLGINVRGTQESFCTKEYRKEHNPVDVLRYLFFENFDMSYSILLRSDTSLNL